MSATNQNIPSLSIEYINLGEKNTANKMGLHLKQLNVISKAKL